jgi:hypothetical protein
MLHLQQKRPWLSSRCGICYANPSQNHSPTYALAKEMTNGYGDPLSSFWGGRGRKFESCRTAQCKPLSVLVLAGAYCLWKWVAEKAPPARIPRNEPTKSASRVRLGGEG